MSSVSLPPVPPNPPPSRWGTFFKDMTLWDMVKTIFSFLQGMSPASYIDDFYNKHHVTAGVPPGSPAAPAASAATLAASGAGVFVQSDPMEELQNILKSTPLGLSHKHEEMLNTLADKDPLTKAFYNFVNGGQITGKAQISLKYLWHSARTANPGDSSAAIAAFKGFLNRHELSDENYIKDLAIAEIRGLESTITASGPTTAPTPSTVSLPTAPAPSSVPPPAAPGVTKPYAHLIRADQPPAVQKLLSKLQLDPLNTTGYLNEKEVVELRKFTNNDKVTGEFYIELSEIGKAQPLLKDAVCFLWKEVYPDVAKFKEYLVTLPEEIVNADQKNNVLKVLDEAIKKAVAPRARPAAAAPAAAPPPSYIRPTIAPPPPLAPYVPPIPAAVAPASLPPPFLGPWIDTKQIEKVARDTGRIFFYKAPETELTQCFGNFYPCSVDYNGVRYSNAEAAYQCATFPDRPDIQRQIREAPTAQEAFEIADRYRPYKSTTINTYNIMQQVVMTKFSQHPELQEALKATGTARLIEHPPHPKARDYWGDGGDGSGQNKLGEILEFVRSKL